MRKKIVAANWKMNKDINEAQTLIENINISLKFFFNESDKNIPLIVIIPPFPFIHLCSQLALSADIRIGSQNCSTEEQGAFTGEVSAKMIRSSGAEFVIIGHSERRAYFNETNEQLAKKVIRALANELTPIFCCGERLPEREEKKHFDIVKKQLDEGLFHLNAKDIAKIVIAYEPVWAIGTGVNALPEQAQEMHEYIRLLITKKYSASIAEEISILYGGSCNSANAKQLFANPDVDGGLVGGASLIAEEFVKIVYSF